MELSWLSPTTRQSLTRMLCWVVLLTWGLAILAWLVIAALVLMPIFLETRLSPSGFVALLLSPFAIHAIAAVTLHLWRSCDRCGYHLYQFWNASWLTGTVGRLNEAPRMIDYRAERLFGFYGVGALWSKATKDIAHCGWCGHPDTLSQETASE